MALLFCDSFDHYATADILKKWTSSPNTNYLTIGATGRGGTNGLRVTNTSQMGSIACTVLGGVTEAILAAAVNPSTVGASANSFMCFGSDSAWECGIMVKPDLTVQPFTVNNSGGFSPGHSSYITWIGTPSTAALQLSVWTYIEVKMKCDGSAGTCVVRFNGGEVLNLTGLDTLYSSTTLTRVAFGSAGTSGFSAYIDDVVVMDLNGTSNNAFLGDVTVKALFPSGAGTTTGWTPSAGSNYDCVNETSPNDTDYVSTSTLNAKDTYAFTDAPSGAVIKAVQTSAFMKKTSDGATQAAIVTRSNSTDYDGTAKGISSTEYFYIRKIDSVDPATSTAWTEGGFNAAEFGVKKTA